MLHTWLGSPVIDARSAVAVLTGVLLNASIGWWWADPASALVLVLYGSRVARDAWHEAGHEHGPQ